MLMVFLPTLLACSDDVWSIGVSDVYYNENKGRKRSPPEAII
jgi:hypothetical protein